LRTVLDDVALKLLILGNKKDAESVFGINLVETAGIEPASANPPLLDLHAYSVFSFSLSVARQAGNTDDDFS